MTDYVFLAPNNPKDFRIVIVKQGHDGWKAWIGHREDRRSWMRPFDRHRWKNVAERSVLGTYATRAQAIEAARDMVAMQDVPKLCNWRDVKEARKLRLIPATAGEGEKAT